MKPFLTFFLGILAGWVLATEYPLTIKLVHLHILASPAEIGTKQAK